MADDRSDTTPIADALESAGLGRDRADRYSGLGDRQAAAVVAALENARDKEGGDLVGALGRAALYSGTRDALPDGLRDLKTPHLHALYDDLRLAWVGRRPGASR